jgi:4-hydroxy-tetrahydrodipicolinate reductase
MPGVAVFGVTGRMGQCLVAALRPGALPGHGLRLSGALGSPTSARLGADAAAEGAPTGVLVVADAREALNGATVAIDFSLPQGIGAHARACAEARVPLLLGTTGFDAQARAALESAARTIPVLIAANTSIGVTVLTRLLGQAAAALGLRYDVEISEAHHRHKRDAPSGTALALGEAVARSRGQTLDEVAVFDRHGAFQPRASGSIGFAVLRAGDIVGEHTVTFAADGERVELTHRATDRMTFAHGALRAAEWLIGRPAGLYGMQDVIGP